MLRTFDSQNATHFARGSRGALGSMKITRSKIIEGFQLVGFIGLLVSVFVVPDQWLSGAVRSEAVIGTLVSAGCVIAAAILAVSIKPAVVVVAQLLFVGGAAYLALVPFVAAEVGWQYWQRLALFSAVSATAVFAGWYALRRLRHHAAQQCTQHGRAEDGAPVS